MKEQIKAPTKMCAPMLSLIVLALASCKSVDMGAGIRAFSSLEAARGYGTYLLMLRPVQHGTAHPSPVGEYLFTDKDGRMIDKHRVDMVVSTNPFFAGMYELCEYDEKQSKLMGCWVPFLNHLKEPVLLAGKLIFLDELSTADGTDVILGHLKALWRTDLQDFSTATVAVASVEHILANILRFAGKLWNSSRYADSPTYYEIKYLCERKSTLRPGKLVQINHKPRCSPAPRS